MENHYKDGTWQYPEFAQPEDIFLEIIEQIDSPNFGVQYDPSNALVGGYLGLSTLRDRVVDERDRPVEQLEAYRRTRVRFPEQDLTAIAPCPAGA